MRIWQLLFLASLAALPVQLGKFFFIRDSYVLGLPIDYLAIPFYFSDIVILALIGTFFWSFKNHPKIILYRYKWYIYSTCLFILYLFTLTILTNPIHPTALNLCLRFSGLAIYCLIAAEFFSQPRLMAKAKIVINLSLLWVSLLIIAEFALQRSLNLWLLGERAFDTSTASIAHFSLFGQQLLRSYATFPHPNIAGAFIVVYLILSTSLSRRSEPHISVILSKAKDLFNVQDNLRKNSYRQILHFIQNDNVVILLTPVALLLTFSKTAIFAILLYVLLTATSQKIRYVLLSALAVVGIIIASAQQLIPIASIAERLSLTQAALDLSLINPIFGVGPTNFIRSLATLDLYSISQTRLLQPVHNMFLIFLTETGAVGLLLFCAILFVVVSRATTVKKQALFLIILLIGSLDHFFVTLHQGQLLLWLALGYILNKDKVRVKKPE